MKNRFYLVLLLGLTPLPSFPQESSKPNSQYLFPEFVEGVVLMKSGIKHRYVINYNSLTDQLILVRGPIKLAISNTEQELMDTIYMEGKKFIRLDDKFVEILYRSKTTSLYVQYKCEAKISGESTIYWQNPRGNQREITTVHQQKSTDDYSINTYVIYWVEKQGELFKLTDMWTLRKVFAEQGRLFRKYVNNNKVTFEDIEKIKQLVSYLDR